MRRSPFPVLAAAVLALASPSSQAKPAFVKEAQVLGFAQVTNCASCHQGSPKNTGPFTRMGQYLVKQKTTRKVAEVDLAWLKDFN
jgi:hypothetical protein